MTLIHEFTNVEGSSKDAISLFEAAQNVYLLKFVVVAGCRVYQVVNATDWFCWWLVVVDVMFGCCGVSFFCNFLSCIFGGFFYSFSSFLSIHRPIIYVLASVQKEKLNDKSLNSCRV